MAIANAACEKKADDIVIIDMRKMPSIGDYFVIASGESAPQVKAISENIVDKLRKEGVRPLHVEEDVGDPTWIILDYGDCVAHIFHDSARKFYNLERLWGDAPQRRFKVRKPQGTKKQKHALRKGRKLTHRSHQKRR